MTIAGFWGKKTTKAAGDAAEAQARAFLESRGLTRVASNYRPPGRGAADLDLVMRDPDGTLVFVEVRARRSAMHGGAAGSVTFDKQRRLIRAAQYFLMRYGVSAPCRFDVVALEGNDRPVWLRGAFDASV